MVHILLGILILLFGLGIIFRKVKYFPELFFSFIYLYAMRPTKPYGYIYMITNIRELIQQHTGITIFLIITISGIIYITFRRYIFLNLSYEKFMSNIKMQYPDITINVKKYFKAQNKGYVLIDFNDYTNRLKVSPNKNVILNFKGVHDKTLRRDIMRLAKDSYPDGYMKYYHDAHGYLAIFLSAFSFVKYFVFG